MTMPDDNRQPGLTLPARLIVLAPLAVFALLAILFFARLGAGDAARIPSALINKKIPEFSLPAIAGLSGVAGLADADLKNGHVSLVNVFASWCVPCHQEHPLLMRLAKDPSFARKGLRLIGLAYKDEPENARRFLATSGNPYAAVGADETGRTAIDWGVYGVPETFVVRGDGTIAYKFVGPLNADSLARVLLPEINKAIQQP
jgi:cytochrome c biogenesis protein CcmG, thiol:disulfide interchange protein DsbE